jgi:hypothetical protein
VDGYQVGFSQKSIKYRMSLYAGGGLIRSLGGWGQAKALRKTGTRLKSDERILDIGQSAISRSVQRGEKIAETEDFARQLEKNMYS